MVFELTDELARCPANKLDDLTVSIENLLIGYYEGNLILLISRPLCGFIKAKGLYKSERAEKALNAINNGGGYLPAVLWHIKVVLENADYAKHEIEYAFFSRTISVLPTAFLCENLTDVKFYMKLSRLYFPMTPIRAMYFHGGGGTTVDVFSYLKGLNVVCLVVLDSDVKYPGCKQGDTVRRCVSNYKKIVSYIEVKVLDVHEAENLVPVEFMKKCAYRSGASLLVRMSKKNLLNKLVYLDVKEGVRKGAVTESPKYMDFCRDFYNELYNPRTNTFDKYLSQKRDDLDYLFAQVNADLLEKFVKDNSFAYANDVMSPHRENIAKLVHTFVCCRGNDPLN